MWQAIEVAAKALLPRVDALPWRLRHRALCGVAANALTTGSSDPVLVAEQCRRARIALAKIVGVDATETMLDALFTRFCIGK